MKALVTGATGFIGSHLVEELTKQGDEVCCLVRKSSDLKWLEGLKIKLLFSDCSDKASLRAIMPELDYVFHLAGLTKASYKEEFYCVNAEGTGNLIEAVYLTNPNLKRFVYLSSLAAFGPSLNGSLPNEEIEPHPVSDYGRSKLQGEQAVMGYADKIPVTILRPTAVYGPRDKDFFVLFKMVKRGLIPTWGDGNATLLYVDDLVRCIILASEKEEAIGKRFFVSDGKTYPSSEIIKEIALALGVNPTSLRIPRFVIPLISLVTEQVGRVRKKPGIINPDKLKEIVYPNWTCDTTRIKGIGFEAKVGIKEGIKWTADWYKIHRWL